MRDRDLVSGWSTWIVSGVVVFTSVRDCRGGVMMIIGVGKGIRMQESGRGYLSII